MKFLIALYMTCITSVVYAHSLHYGNQSVELTDIKYTSPALHVKIGETIYYGALFTGPFPQNVLHVLYNDTEYFLGPWCNAGTYLPDNQKECTPCGIGHYCTGGRHRESCTYGAIACNGTNHTFDPEMPTGTDGMYNRALTMSEVNQYIPATDISQWEEIYNGDPADEIIYIPCEAGIAVANPNDERLTILDNEISAGTYLVAHQYNHDGMISAMNGESDSVSTAYIVVFDHNVAYRPVHICNYFGHYFDTSHVPYSEYNYTLPTDFYNINENNTNISNLANLTGIRKLILYKLK